MGQAAVVLDVGGLSQEIALHLFAKLALEKVKLGGCLDAFREHGKIEGAAEPEDQTHDRGGLAIGIDRFDEGAIDLDLVEGKGMDVRERRIARAKIVHGDADAHHLEPPQRHQRAFQVADERRFGDLQFQAPGRKARFDQNLMDHLGKVLIVDLNGGDIDRDGQRLRPARGLTAGGPQHPLSDLENDARFFGNGNEFRG